jgi:hypothetical protein
MYEYDFHQLIPPQVFTSAQEEELLDASPAPQPDDTMSQWDLDLEFEQLFRPPPREEASAGHPTTAARVDRRRKRPRLVQPRWPSVLGAVIAGISATVAAAVGVLGATVTYDPLRQLAFPTAHGLASAWPLLVYGPWFIACLSILHAAAHRRRVRAAWIALIFFSAIAMALSIVHAPKTLTAISTAGLPPVSALAAFHLLFRQITLLHPRHAKIPRQHRH